MEIEALIKNMKEIYSAIMDFIDATDNSETEFNTLIDILEKQDIFESKEEIGLLFHLLSIIANDHHRTSDFFDKLEKIYQYLITQNPSPSSDFIPDYEKSNKRILFLLLEKKLFKPDEKFLKEYYQCNPDSHSKFVLDNILLPFKLKDHQNMQIKLEKFYYLYPKMKEFIDENLQKQIEDEILQEYEVEIPIFEEKCRIGENDSYICSLIRSDSVEEFIAYVNRKNISLTSKINPSIYETNKFLIDKEPTLIEYAAFYGSIQIIQYLKYNNVQLTFPLWFYAIHSNNAELIHFLEENDVKPEKNEKNSHYKSNLKRSFFDQKNDFNYILVESIKCHHNAISNYIKDNFCEQNKTNYQNSISFSDTVVNSLNFFFFPSCIEDLICKQRNLKGFDISQLCFSLKTITIPPSVTSIGDKSFSDCSLTQITIPSSVISIGDYVFNRCKSLISIEIPSSVTSIGNSAFNSCSSLVEISIPSSVTKISKSLFEGCTSLKQITIPSSVIEIEDYALSGCTSLEQITIPSSITSIGNGAFNSCSSLVEISIPSSVTKISKSLFEGCTSLKQITIPSSVTEIEDQAFFGCTSLEQISLPSSLKSIGLNSFSECKSLIQLIIPSSVESFKLQSFEKYESLTQITIPSCVTEIEDNAFYGCTSLVQITLPPFLTKIGRFAFRGCSSLAHILIPSSVTEICCDAFNSCSSLEEISIQSSLTKISKNLFYKCKALTKITIPSSVTEIEDYAFFGCSSLTEIMLPSSLTKIGFSAFSGCASLTQIVIPSSITSIGNYVFSGCSSLSKVTIPPSVTSIGEYAFFKCPFLPPRSNNNSNSNSSLNSKNDGSTPGKSSVKISLKFEANSKTRNKILSPWGNNKK